jgi:hypothetical protein
MKINRSVITATAIITSFFAHVSLATNAQNNTPGLVYNPDMFHQYLTPISATHDTPIQKPLATFFDTAKTKVTPHHPDFFSHAFSAFIQSTYNNSGYADVLSRDSRHITDFLQLSNEYNLSTEHVYTGLRLFLNKLKEADFVDDTVTNHILSTLPEELDKHFPLNPLNSAKQKSPSKLVENIMLTEFTEHLQKPTVSTELFFKDLATTITTSLKEVGAHDQTAMRERLRGIIFRLTDLLLSKTLWFIQQPESIWPSVLQAAHSISLLCSNGLINHLDDVCELHKTLISRFISFIDQSGHALSVSWYSAIENDLTEGLVPFLETPELDGGIASKKELLIQALARGKVCAIAQEHHGIIIE